MPDLLKLRARDEDDFRIMAALLQDALVSLSDMAFLPEEKRFVLLLNRFRWEAAGPAVADDRADPPAGRAAAPVEDVPFDDEDVKSAARFERIHCALCFDRVVAVRMKGIDRRARDRILELLTIEAGDEAIRLVFAGDATIRLEVEALRCSLEDVGEAWPTQWRPLHRFDAGGEDG